MKTSSRRDYGRAVQWREVGDLPSLKHGTTTALGGTMKSIMAFAILFAVAGCGDNGMNIADMQAGNDLQNCPVTINIGDVCNNGCGPYLGTTPGGGCFCDGTNHWTCTTHDMSTHD